MTKVPHSCKGWTKHQKQIETQLAELKAETKRLEEEKETAIREKCDYTINQERLGENIWRDFGKRICR